MREVFEKCPHWQKSDRHEREVRSELYNVLLEQSIMDIPKVSEIAQNIMKILKCGVAG